MSSNYGYDANGWEREPFPARDEFAEPRPRPPVVDLMAALEASLAAVKHPDCEPCQRGQGITAPGPPHAPRTEGHAAHCSCDGCF